MTLISSYVFRQVVGAMLLVLVSLTGVTWIAVALRQLDIVTGQGQDALAFLKVTSLAVPTLLALIAPIALLIATIYLLARLNGDSELIVITAAGAPVWRLLAPLAVIAVVVALAVSLVNHHAAPWSQRRLKEFIDQMRADLITQVLQPGRFTSPELGLSLHIRDRMADGQLEGLVIHDGRDPKQSSSYLAETGFLIKQGSGAYLVMERGHIIRRGEGDTAAQIVTFDRYAFDLNRFEQKGDDQALRPRERFTDELWAPDPADAGYKQFPGRYRTELHDRFATALYPFAFVLIALAFMGQARTTRQNRIQAIAWAFTLAIAIRLAGIGATNLAILNERAIVLLYALPLGASVAALWLTHRSMRPRPAPAAVRFMLIALERIGASLAARVVRSPVGARFART